MAPLCRNFAAMPKSSNRRIKPKKLLRPSAPIEVVPIPGLPEIHAGDDLAAAIVAAAFRARIKLKSGDVLVVAQKIVSKAEGCVTQLAAVVPSAQALQLGAKLKKDPRLIEVILGESRRIATNDTAVVAGTRESGRRDR